MPTKDLDKKKVADRERARRYRERKQGVTGVTEGRDGRDAGVMRDAEIVTPEADIRATVVVDLDGGRYQCAPMGFKRPPMQKTAKASSRQKTMGLPVTDSQWAETFRDEFWPEYVKLRTADSRAEAYRAWCEIPHPDGQGDFTKLWAAFEAYRGKLTDPRFAKMGATWLRDYHRNLILDGML